MSRDVAYVVAELSTLGGLGDTGDTGNVDDGSRLGVVSDRLGLGKQRKKRKGGEVVGG